VQLETRGTGDEAQALGGEIGVAPAEGGGARLTASFPGL
jgi:hypothetical protein